MRNLIILILTCLLILLTSCGQRKLILNNKDFNELRLLEQSVIENIWLTTDPKTINKLKTKVYYIDNEDCHWTTPDNVIQLLKNGKIIETYGYCYDYQTNLDNLKYKLHKTIEHEVTFTAKRDWQDKLKQLYSNNHVKVDYISPDSLNIHGFGVLGINIIDTTKEEEQPHTIKLFDAVKDLYGISKNDLTVNAWKFSPDGTIDYIAEIRCDKNWSDKFDTTILRRNTLTSNFHVYAYKMDEYKIIYRDWTD